MVVKSFPEEVQKRANLQHVLCVHTLNALATEVTQQGNMLAITTLAQLYLLLLTTSQL